jgi:predicted GH43/DUF377 family glycosyl hydrolase
LFPVWHPCQPNDQQTEHHSLLECDASFLTGPEEPWESLKIGGGAPPVHVSGGWLTFYHGVSGTADSRIGAAKTTVADWLPNGATQSRRSREAAQKGTKQ